MSGGVDSSVAAILLQEQGYDVFGIFLKFWSDPEIDEESKFENKCCSVESRMMAMRVAEKFNFPLYTINVKNEFKELIVDDFIETYASGATPNPCIRCNKFVKFDLLLKKAKGMGADFIATGHYAITHDDKLYRGEDKSKDQSYFLYNLTPGQIKHVILPIGKYEKEETRKIADQHKIPQAKLKDSQDICFAPRKHHAKFLKKYISDELQRPGDIIDVNTKEIMGQHDGLPFFTLGQRSGLKIGGTGPYYVVGWKADENALLVSTNSNDPLLMSDSFLIKDTNWISEKPDPNKKYDVQIRYQSALVPGVISQNKIKLDKTVRAMAPGQSAVLYDGEEVLGGGIIDKIF